MQPGGKGVRKKEGERKGGWMWRSQRSKFEIHTVLLEYVHSTFLFAFSTNTTVMAKQIYIHSYYL